ncbi:MAG: hypothetical protein IJE23_00460 [Tyzzerella sp.]|nr:hypothetical protein [Tyzzerella sp.]
MMIALKNIDEDLRKEFQRLSDDFWDFKESDTKELTHSIHNYPAVMVYPISRNILNIVKKYEKLTSLMDPFMGSGTVLLEGVLAGISDIYGNDLNPLAHRISKAKTTLLDKIELEKGKRQLLSLLEQSYFEYKEVLLEVDGYVQNCGYDITAKVNEKENWGAKAPQILNAFIETKGKSLKIPEITNLGFWFVPTVIIELQLIKHAISRIQNEDVKEYFEVVFSETTRLVSNRRNGEFKMYRMQPEKVKVYKPNVKEQFIKILNSNVEKMCALQERVTNDNKSKVHFSFDDAASLESVPDDSIDIVITSPPYGDSRTTVAYGQFSRVSLQWCDYEKYSYKDIIDIDKKLMGGKSYKKGFENNICSKILKDSLLEIMSSADNLERAGDVYSFYKDLQDIMQTVTQKCRINSYQFWVVGNRTVKGVQLMTSDIIVEMAKTMGLVHVTTLERNITNKVMPSLNSPTNEPGKKVKTMNEELIVVLRKGE